MNFVIWNKQSSLPKFLLWEESNDSRAEYRPKKSLEKRLNGTAKTKKQRTVSKIQIDIFEGKDSGLDFEISIKDFSDPSQPRGNRPSLNLWMPNCDLSSNAFTGSKNYLLCTDTNAVLKKVKSFLSVKENGSDSEPPSREESPKHSLDQDIKRYEIEQKSMTEEFKFGEERKQENFRKNNANRQLENPKKSRPKALL